MFLNKKSILFIVSLTLIFCSISPVYAESVAIINEDNLNVRSGPGTEYERIGQVNSNEHFDIIEELDDWVKINFNHTTGWITKEYITIEANLATIKNEENEELNELPNKITILYDQTHLRSGPSTDFEIIDFAEIGDVFEVISEKENWIEVTNGEISGFIFREFIKPTTSDVNKSGIKQKTIVIDPGHGGRDVGAISVSGQFERDITYLTAKELEKELTSLGANVILARPENNYVPLESRTALTHTVDTDAFLSLHYNSFPEEPSVSGIESFYYHNQYDILASLIHNEIIKETDERDRGISNGDFHVIRQTFRPGVLLELGFLSNPESDALLQTTAYQKKIVTGIVKGLQRYFHYYDY